MEVIVHGGDLRRQWRREAMERDGWQCVWCGEADNLTTHHIIPQRRGGSDESSNLLTLCRECHDEMEVLERLYDGQCAEYILTLPARPFMHRYVWSQRQIGRATSSRDRYVIEGLLAGR